MTGNCLRCGDEGEIGQRHDCYNDGHAMPILGPPSMYPDNPSPITPRGTAMKEFKLKIDMENAAFAELPMNEVSRILRELSEVIADEHPGVVDGYELRDINGNTVGKVSVK